MIKAGKYKALADVRTDRFEMIRTDTIVSLNVIWSAENGRPDLVVTSDGIVTLAVFKECFELIE